MSWAGLPGLPQMRTQFSAWPETFWTVMWCRVPSFDAGLARDGGEGDGFAASPPWVGEVSRCEGDVFEVDVVDAAFVAELDAEAA